MRAADGDRKRVAEQLRSAHDEGRLTLTEYDERVQQAWAARTYGELACSPQTSRRSRPDPRRRHAVDIAIASTVSGVAGGR
jgi:hypothetical protein